MTISRILSNTKLKGPLHLLAVGNFNSLTAILKVCLTISTIEELKTHLLSCVFEQELQMSVGEYAKRRPTTFPPVPSLGAASSTSFLGARVRNCG